MANKIFYIDPKNGSNDNDGSTPDKAWADATPALSSDDSTADEPALLYVRRSGDQTFADDIDWSDNPNRIIIGWPNEGEPYYDVRPQDGQDAGWDDDDNTKPKIIINKGVNTKSTTPSVLGFYNMNLETSDDGTDLAIQYSIGNVSFENCIINHQRDGDSDSFLSFHRIDDTLGSSVISIKNCDVSADGMLFGCRDDVNWPEVDFTFNSYKNKYNGDFGNAIWYWRASRTTTNINIKEDNINVVNRVLYFDEDNYNYALITLNVDKTVSNSSSDLIYFRSRYRLIANITNSSIKTGGGNVVEQVHYSNVGEDYKTDLTIKNCDINSNYLMRINNNYSDDRNSSIGDIIIDNCNIHCNNAVFYYDSNTNIYTKKFIINNCSIVADGIVSSDYSQGSLAEFTYINLKNSSLASYVIRNVRNIFMTARNSTFNKLGDNGDTSSTNTFYFFDCTIEGSSHKDSITINGGNVSGEYPYSIIDAINVTASLTKNMNATFRNSKASALPGGANGKIELFSCMVNDNPMPYAKLTRQTLIKASNIFRLNGTEGSIELSSPSSNILGFSLDRLSFVKPSDKTNLKLFIASQNNCPELYNFLINISYVVDDTAYTHNSDISEVSTSNQEWSGLYNGYKSYEVSFDVPSHDTDTELQVVLQAFPKALDGISSPIFVDLKPEWS